MNEIEQLTPKPEQQVFTFENVAMYRSGIFGIGRTDCKTVKVTTGVKYAQYTDAIRVEYLEKGKRMARAFILDYKPWLRVLDLKKAVTPADAMQANGDGSSVSRYASHDSRWETDFEDANEQAPWLLAIGAGDREGACLERCEKITPEVSR